MVFHTLGSGPPLLCHPGGPGLSARYLGNLGGLSRSNTLIIISPDGVDGSEGRGRRATVADLAQDVDDLRDHLGLDEIALLGHSYGALVAARFAARNPVRVSRLVLVAPPVLDAPGLPPVAETLQDLSALQVPTLVVSGARDGRLVDCGRAAAGAVTGCHHTVLPNGDHYPWLDDASAFCDAVNSFLEHPPLQKSL